MMKKLIIFFIACCFHFSLWAQNTGAYIEINHPDHPEGGVFFSKKEYQSCPLPNFAESREKMPSPVFEENTEWGELYWKAWEMAFDHFRRPYKGSGNVSNYIDEAFNERFYLWDTSFMTMFCNVAYALVPGISSLDNFYAHQFENGEMSCQLYETTGGVPQHNLNKEKLSFYSYTGWDIENKQEGFNSDYDKKDSDGNFIEIEKVAHNPVTYVGREVPSPSYLTLDRLDHPICSWAELEHYQYSGDKERLTLVYNPLVQYYRALDKYLKQGNGLYITDWASMDNSPRNPYLKGGGCGVDISSEMAMLASDLSRIARILNLKKDARFFQKEGDKIKRRINDLMWDTQNNFYYDLTLNGEFVPVKTIAGFWTLLAEVPSAKRAKLMVQELNNPSTFNRKHRVPTVAADQEGYNPMGGYWKGAVWAPTQTMVIRGLEKYGYSKLAREIALNHLRNVNTVYKNTGTIWENYAADAIEPGQPARKDFVGWSGIGPILYLMEYAIGLKPNAAENRIDWNINSAEMVGCRNYHFNGIATSLIANPNHNKFNIEVISDDEYTLCVFSSGRVEEYKIQKGTNNFEF
ncbi:alpha,alpha-trehalase [Maribellus luteus]|uniref:Alpha,alpha-trehalase n=1 Tax=Maribellus luteus TaxID=2305463 RepID=A0A399T3B0_9BACT|nr:trehalase family glycosidase [Maribellus luteus]RIJ50826.1 alpha,alpha-trehalase [Maribellus luteus]